MADDDEAINAQVDVDDAIKTLLEATRSQATVNAALVTQLMNINTTQAALQVQIAAIAAPPPGPVDPITKQVVDRAVNKPAQLALPAPPAVPDKPVFDGAHPDELERSIAWKSFMRFLYQRTVTFARRHATVLQTNILNTPFQHLVGWQEYVAKTAKPVPADAMNPTAIEIQEMVDYKAARTRLKRRVDTPGKRQELATKAYEMCMQQPAMFFDVHKTQDEAQVINYCTAHTRVQEKVETLMQLGLMQMQASVLEALDADLYDTIMHLVKPETVKATLLTFRTQQHTYQGWSVEEAEVFNAISSAGASAIFYLDQRFDPLNKFLGIQLHISVLQFGQSGEHGTDAEALQKLDALKRQLTEHYTQVSGIIDQPAMDRDSEIADMVVTIRDETLKQILMDKIAAEDPMMTDPRKVRRWIQGRSHSTQVSAMLMQNVQFAQKAAEVDPQGPIAMLNDTPEHDIEYDSDHCVVFRVEGTRVKACTNCDTWYLHDPVECTKQCRMCNYQPGDHANWCIRKPAQLRFKAKQAGQQPVQSRQQARGAPSTSQSAQQKRFVPRSSKPPRKYTGSESARLADLSLEHSRALAAHADAIARDDQGRAEAIAANVQQIDALRQETIAMFAAADPITDRVSFKLSQQLGARGSNAKKSMHANVASLAYTIGDTITADANKIAPLPAAQPPTPRHKRHSILVDTGATKSTAGSATLVSQLHDKRQASVQLQTADKSRVFVNTIGSGTLYSADENGRLQPIPTGPSLVDKRLHDLLSPAAMFEANGTVQKFVLTRQGGMIILASGAKIPLRWDGNFGSTCQNYHASISRQIKFLDCAICFKHGSR